MATVLVVIHVIVCLFLITVVLLQGGKGAQMGSVFGGGSSQTLFGSRGAATFMNKLTTGVAVVFMITSLVLALVSVRGGSIVRSTVIPEETAPQSETTQESGGTTPVVPEKPAAEKTDVK